MAQQKEQKEQTEQPKLTPEQIEALAEAFASMLINNGERISFDEYTERHPDKPLSEDDFRTAFLLGEQKAATSWGYGPGAGKRLSPEAWGSLPLPEQARFFREGGRLAEVPAPPDPEDAKVMTNKKGQSITHGEFTALPLKEQADFCLAR